MPLGARCLEIREGQTYSRIEGITIIMIPSICFPENETGFYKHFAALRLMIIQLLPRCQREEAAEVAANPAS